METVDAADVLAATRLFKRKLESKEKPMDANSCRSQRWLMDRIAWNSWNFRQRKSLSTFRSSNVNTTKKQIVGGDFQRLRMVKQSGQRVWNALSGSDGYVAKVGRLTDVTVSMR